MSLSLISRTFGLEEVQDAFRVASDESNLLIRCLSHTLKKGE